MTRRQWVVLLDTGPEPGTSHVYGPIGDEEYARQFAEFLTAEVDPARHMPLIDPIDELLGHWNYTRSAPAATDG